MHVDFDQNNAGINFVSWNNSSSFEKISNPHPDSNNNSEFVGQFTAGYDNGIGVGSDDFSSYFMCAGTYAAPQPNFDHIFCNSKAIRRLKYIKFILY